MSAVTDGTIEVIVPAYQFADFEPGDEVQLGTDDGSWADYAIVATNDNGDGGMTLILRKVA